MKKLWFYISLLALTALVACQAPTANPGNSPTLVPAAKNADSFAVQPARCTMVTQKPGPGTPTQKSLYAPVTDNDNFKGPKDAKITIIDYSDFQ